MKWHKTSEILPVVEGTYLCYYDENNSSKMKKENFAVLEFGTCYDCSTGRTTKEKVFSTRVEIQDSTWGKRNMRYIYEKEKIWWTQGLSLTFPNGQKVNNI